MPIERLWIEFDHLAEDSGSFYWSWQPPPSPQLANPRIKLILSGHERLRPPRTLLRTLRTETGYIKLLVHRNHEYSGPRLREKVDCIHHYGPELKVQVGKRLAQARKIVAIEQ